MLFNLNFLIKFIVLIDVDLIFWMVILNELIEDFKCFNILIVINCCNVFLWFDCFNVGLFKILVLYSFLYFDNLDG